MLRRDCEISNLYCRRVKLLMFVCVRVLPLEDRAVPPGQDRYSAAVGRIRPRSSPPVRPQTTLSLRPPLGVSAGTDEITVSTTRRQTTGHLVHYLTNLFLHLLYIVFIFYYLLNTNYLLFKRYFIHRSHD